MALTRYDLVVGTTATDLQNRVRAKQATGNVIVYNMFQRGGCYCQGVGTGSLEVGTVTQYQIISSANVDSFSSLVSSMLPTMQPIGTPVVYNSALFQVMGTIQAYNMTGQDGADGKTPEIRVSDGHIQWKYKTDVNWTNLVSLDSLTGASPEFRVTAGTVQWKLTTDSNWTVLVDLDQITGPRGDVGPRGETGERGPRGDAGPAGVAGPQGVAGEQGPRGPQGPAGSAGPQGAKGDTGPQGVKGDTGPRGPAGEPASTVVLTGTVVKAGTPVEVSFGKTYSSVPTVVQLLNGDSNSIVTPIVSNVTTTGCSVLVVRTRGTLLPSTGPVENAPAGTAFRVAVIGA